MLVEAVLWIVRTGASWSVKGVWHRILAAMTDDAEFDHLSVDGTIVRAHQHAAGGKKGSSSGRWPFPRRPEQQAASPGSWPWLPDPDHPDGRPSRRCTGCPTRIILTAGQAGDAPQALRSIEEQPAKAVIADTAHDTDTFRATIAARGTRVVIPSDPSRARRLVECCISKLEQFRSVATR